MVVVVETPTRLLKDRGHLSRGLFIFLNFERMEFEQTPPAIEQGKRFIEVNPDTAKGIEAMKQLDEAFIDLKEWIEDVWGCNDYPYYRQAVDKWLAVNKWGMEVLATLIKGTLDATDFKSI